MTTTGTQRLGEKSERRFSWVASILVILGFSPSVVDLLYLFVNGAPRGHEAVLGWFVITGSAVVGLLMAFIASLLGFAAFSAHPPKQKLFGVACAIAVLGGIGWLLPWFLHY